MTPVVFITFVVSLTLVGYRNSVARFHYHGQNQSRLPAWLHRLIYRGRPYEYVVIDEKGRSVRCPVSPRFYRTKQGELLRMEAARAFEIRTTVLVLLSLLSIASVFGLWSAACWAVDTFRSYTPIDNSGSIWTKGGRSGGYM